MEGFRLAPTNGGKWNPRFPFSMIALPPIAIRDVGVQGVSMSLLKELTVTQSNDLVESVHSLTLNEKRLILCSISQLDPRKPLAKDGVVRVHAEAFADVFDIEVRHAYEALEDAATRLYDRDIRKIGKQGKVNERVRWVYHVKYMEGQGYVTLGFSPMIVPYLTLLHREFTTFELKQVGRLSSFHSIRLYELFSQFRKAGQRNVTLERLKEMLDLGEKYPAVADFRRYVLDSSVEEINEKTDLTVQVIPKRKGRKVLGFEFDIDVNEQPSLPL